MSAICFECEKEITNPDDVFCRECLTDANDSMEAWVEKFVAEKRELEARVADLLAACQHSLSFAHGHVRGGTHELVAELQAAIAKARGEEER